MAESFDQKEPLTVRLSGLLTEYPPGDSILKELLQNADDAGARVVTYAIDTTWHGKERLCDAGLAEHQGPALLVYNDAVFTDKDFDSLKKLGNSMKIKDKMATGKFGLGFNSVYGWTDTPSILTGKSFIALSPHQRLVTPGRSSGLKIDFVNPPDNIDMTDQLDAFKLVANPLDREFAGTVIRIPLRTQNQAKTSEISNVAVSPEELLAFFESFQVDVAESLVFMRNIERVTFSINGEELGTTTLLHIAQVRKARSAVSSAVLTMTPHSGAVRYVISQKYKHDACSVESTRIYQVQQTIFDMHTQVPSDLITWALESKAFPWVTLAARLDEGSPSRESRIFVTLPLPGTLDNTCVNIHGIFALKRDRRSLWTDDDSKGGTQLKEIDWNNFLFKVVIPIAWNRLLVELTRQGCVRVADYFPLMSASPGSIWLTLTKDVLNEVLNERSKIWYSTTDLFLPLEEGYLVDEAQDTTFIDVFQRVSMPLFKQVPDQILRLLSNSSHTYTTVNPASVCNWLRRRDQQTKAPLLVVSDAMCLLQYICRRGELEQLYDISVFLCCDGQLRPLSLRPVTAEIASFDSQFYIGTDEERNLFNERGDLFLSLDTYPSLVSTQIRDRLPELSKTLNLERFGLREFKKFCADRLFSPLRLQHPEIIEMSEFGIQFEWIQKLWCWLDQKPLTEVSKAVDLEWLIPLHDGKALFLVSTNSRPLITQHGKGGDLITAIHEGCGATFPMVHHDFHVSTAGYLRATRLILDPTDLEALVTSITPEIVSGLDNTLRDHLRQHLCSVIGQAESSTVISFKEKLLKLPIFKKLEPCEETPQNWLKTVYSPLPSHGVKPVPSVPCVPVIPHFHFFDASAEDDRILFTRLGYTILESQQLLTDFIIPEFAAQPAWLMDPLADFIFTQAASGSISQLSSVAFVTVQSKDGSTSTKRLKPIEVIERNSSIAELFFDDEAVFGSGIYSDQGSYQPQMKLLGMKLQLDSEVAEERIGYYSARNPAEKALFDKSNVLLDLLNKHATTVPFKNDWLHCFRLPAIKDGDRCVLPPSECRSNTFKPLIYGVLGIVHNYVGPGMEKSFGWNLPLDPQIVAKRIDVIVCSPSSGNVHSELLAVLEYLQKLSDRRDEQIVQYISSVKSSLSTRDWLPGLVSGLWPPERVFFRDARDFQPYMSELPLVFSQNFQEILKTFGVQDQPLAEQLVEFIATLDDSQRLSERKLEAVVQALKQLHSSQKTSFSKELKIPDSHGRLLRIDQFHSSNDGDQDGVRYAHARVPRSIVLDYGIRQLEGDLNLFHHLNGPDLFDYCQKENIVDRISKSLKEVSLWSAFNEFVANAEDSGSASSVTWVLDPQGVRFSSQKLFCDTLKSWQSGALYVYNDGMFSEADFKALVQVGMGNKSKDNSKIGNYGLGALTMYLFTDVPSMISGEYFVMFDPTRQYLPYDPRSGRRLAGLKIPLAQMNPGYKDHLVPFIGIGGYSIDKSKFEGTIFRFPLRSERANMKSRLTSQSETLTWVQLRDNLAQTYCDQARKSLVMLKRVNNISFHLRYSTAIPERNSVWSVSSTHSPAQKYTKNEVTPFSSVEFSSLDILLNRAGSDHREKWIIHWGYVSAESIKPPQLRKLIVEERLIASEDRMKKDNIPDVAVAAKLSGSTQLREHHYYNSLPLPEKIGFPVSFHSRFAITPDRRTLRVDSDWNKFLATSCIPTLYFVLLETLLCQPEYNFESYDHWPGTRNQKLHSLCHTIQTSFWTQLLNSRYELFSDSRGLRQPIDHTIFDLRSADFRSDEYNSVLSLVQLLRPSQVITNAEKVWKGLLQNSDQLDISTVAKLDSAYVQALLRQKSAKSILESSVDDSGLRNILKFCLTSGKLEELDQCWALRLDDNSISQFQLLKTSNKGKTKIYYLVDKYGYNLLKGLVPGSLINPDACPFQNSETSELSALFNVQRLNGTAIDTIVRAKLGPDSIKTYENAEATWVRNIAGYTSSNSMAVEFYRTLPTIALSNRPNTFISLEACESLPILPPIMSVGLRKIADKLGLYVLGNTHSYRPLAEMVRAWAIEERFVECLRRVVNSNCSSLENILRDKLDKDDVEMCVTLFRKVKSNGQWLTSSQIQVLRFVPLWEAATETAGAPSTVAAANAILIPSKDWIFPWITWRRDYVVAGSSVLHALIVSLGAKTFESYQYLVNYVFPCLPEVANPAQLRALKKLLDFVVNHLSEWSQSQRMDLRTIKLVADRGCTLRVPPSIYDPGEPVFEAAFRGSNSAFPHQELSLSQLAFLGVNKTLTKENYIASVRQLEQDYNEMRPDLFPRAQVLWSAFVNRLGQLGTEWTARDIQSLASLHFVPVDRFISDSTQNYRDIFIRERTDGRYALSTMKEIISPQYAPLAWTQRPICISAPPAWASALFKFSPSIEDVVRHLIEMSTVVARSCRISEASFFHDLRKTYDYLNDPKHSFTASPLLLKHLDKPIWLNEEISLEQLASATPFRSGAENIASLKWLSADSIFPGVLFDLPKSNMYSIKLSLEPYNTLLRASGAKAFDPARPTLSLEKVEDHGAQIFHSIQSMRGSTENLCDITIVVESRRFQAHRVVLAAVSTYFRTLFSGVDWTELGTGVIDLDKELSLEDDETTEGRDGEAEVEVSQSTQARYSRPYGSAESVGLVIEWVYNGALSLDDETLFEGEAIVARLDLYLDTLQLADVWDIPGLRTHVENRILGKSKLFIGPDNLQGVRDRAEEYNASEVFKYCVKVYERYKPIVEKVSKDEGR